MELIVKILNIDIKEGTLYEKEFNALRDIFEDNKENNEKETKEAKTDNNESTDLLDVSDLDPETYFSRIVEDEYTPEMQAIKDKAITDGTFMKAPNGKASNLNERQWIHVRTKAFKDWFGDWENDAENASKVVDKNSEPLVVYHGSDSYGFDIFDPKMSDDKRSLFFSGSKFIASTYTKFEPLRNEVIRERLIKNNAIELIKNKDYDALKKLIEETLNYNAHVPKDENKIYDSRYSEYIDETIYKLRKELLNSNLKENEIYAIQAEMSKLEDLMWFGKNYRLDIISHNFNGKEKIKLKIIDNLEEQYNSSIFKEEGVIFNGTPEELIESIYTKTKIYDIFLNIKNPLVLDNQIGEFGANHNWNRVEYKGKAYKTRDIAKIALEDGFDGVVFKDIVDRGPYAGDNSLDPTTDRDIANAYFHEFEDSYTGTNIYAADIFIAFDSNQVKSATDNIGSYSTENNHIKYSTITESSTSSVESFINKFDLSERAEIIRQINDSEIQISCK